MLEPIPSEGEEYEDVRAEYIPTKAFAKVQKNVKNRQDLHDFLRY
jgi:hypothetical protein